MQLAVYTFWHGRMQCLWSTQKSFRKSGILLWTETLRSIFGHGGGGALVFPLKQCIYTQVRCSKPCQSRFRRLLEVELSSLKIVHTQEYLIRLQDTQNLTLKRCIKSNTKLLILKILCTVWVADNSIKKQQKFYSIPKRYKQIRRFEQRPFVGATLIPDEGPLLETWNLFLSLR